MANIEWTIDNAKRYSWSAHNFVKHPRVPAPLNGLAQMCINENKQRRDWGPAFRIVMRLLVIAALVWLTHLSLGWTMAKIDGFENASTVRIGVLGFLLLLYIVLMAIPFVPGV